VERCRALADAHPYMTARSRLVAAINKELGDRQLVWFGTRGDDVESAGEIEQLTCAFSLINTYSRRSTVAGLSLEDLSGERVDLDVFDLDDHPRDAPVGELRQALLRALARPSAVFTYRPSAFLSAVTFARRDYTSYLGLFSGQQQAFEHKPWVETAVAELGLPQIPWRYVADSDRGDVLRQLRDGPVVLRRSRTTGGVGLTRLDDEQHLESLWPDEDEAFVSVAPFLADTIPLNVSGVVWRDGGVTVHPVSVQLIGIESLTKRNFGYCGNDFAAVTALGEKLVEEIERSVILIGEWLGRQSYLGAFGVDFLVSDGVALFTEVNPRFQGSTHLSTEISVELGLGCLLLEHIAAFLGIDRRQTPSLWDIARSAPPRAHLVLHSNAGAPRSLDPGAFVDAFADTGSLVRADVLTRPDLRTDPAATVARFTVDRQVTECGFDLASDISAAIDSAMRCVELPAAPGSTGYL
jgi:hypothetical protein